MRLRFDKVRGSGGNFFETQCISYTHSDSDVTSSYRVYATSQLFFRNDVGQEPRNVCLLLRHRQFLSKTSENRTRVPGRPVFRRNSESVRTESVAPLSPNLTRGQRWRAARPAVSTPVPRHGPLSTDRRSRQTEQTQCVLVLDSDNTDILLKQLIHFIRITRQISTT